MAKKLVQLGLQLIVAWWQQFY